MIDWYIILLLAAGIIIFNLNKTAEHLSPLEFLMAGEQLGVKQGTILLWLSLFGLPSLSMPIYFVFHFGLLISMGYYLCFVLFIYFVTSYFMSSFYKNGIRELILPGLYQRRFTSIGFRLFLPLLVFANMEGVLLQLSLANKLFRLWFPQKPILFVALLLLFCVITAGLGGMFVIYRSGHVLLLLCGFSFLFVPLFFYLKDGIHPIFQSYLSYERDQQLPLKEILILFAAIPIAFIGWLLTNSFQFQVLQSIKQNYRSSSLKLSIFCFASIPASTLIYGIYIVSTQKSASLLLFTKDLLQIPSGLMILMIILIWLTGVVYSVSISFYSMAVLFLHSFPDEWQPAKKIRIMYYLVIMLSLIVFVSQFWLVNYIKVLFIGYLLFYLTISFPLGLLIKGKRKYSYWPAICLFGFWLIGILFFLKSHNAFLAVMLSIALSVICLIGLYLSKFLKIVNISQK